MVIRSLAWRDKYIAPFIATLLAVQSVGLAHESNELRPPPPPLPESMVKGPELEIEKELQDIFFCMFRGHGPTFLPPTFPALYESFNSHLDRLRKVKNAENYIPGFIKTFNKENGITVLDFTNKLKILNKKIDDNAGIDSLVECINSYRDLCTADSNRKFQEICFQSPFDPYDDTFHSIHQTFQTKLSEKLITELNSLQDYNSFNISYLGKINRISLSLGSLHLTSRYNQLHKLALTASEANRLDTKIPAPEYLVLGSLPELEKFFQTTILKNALNLKLAFSSDRSRIEKFIPYINEFLSLNRILNSKHSLTTTANFFKNINSQLVDFFIETINNPNHQLREKSFLNLYKYLSYLEKYVRQKENDHLAFIVALRNIVNQNYNGQLGDYESYYHAISLYPAKTNLSKRTLETIQKDLIQIIQGSADEPTKLMVKEFLAKCLLSILDNNHNSFSNYIKNISTNSESQINSRNFSNTTTPLSNLFEITLKPDFFFVNAFKAVNHNRFTINELKGLNQQYLKLNQQYLNAEDLLGSVFLTANFKLNNSRSLNILNQAYVSYERRLSKKLSLEGRPYGELSSYVDAFIQGRSYGHYLESKLVTASAATNNVSCSDCPTIVSTEIKKDRLKPSNIRTEFDPYTFPPTREMRSWLRFDFIGRKTDSLNLSEADENFILGALTAIPNTCTNELDLETQCKKRYLQIAEERYPKIKDILLHEVNASYFIGTAIDYIRSKNRDILFKSPTGKFTEKVE